MFRKIPASGPREAQYQLLLEQLESLLEGEPNPIANLANAAALLHQFYEGINWVGFYLVEDRTLVLGPFQGLPACTRIPFGQGVCGTAAETRETQRIPDVCLFPGHIACDPQSRSEIVVPIEQEGRLVGVLDIDSPQLDRFDPVDERYLEEFVRVLADSL